MASMIRFLCAATLLLLPVSSIGNPDARANSPVLYPVQQAAVQDPQPQDASPDAVVKPDVVDQKQPVPEHPAQEPVPKTEDQPDAAPDDEKSETPDADEPAENREQDNDLELPLDELPAPAAIESKTESPVESTALVNVIPDTSFLLEGKSPQSIDQLESMEEHFADLAERVAPATVNIQIGMAQGSGVIVSRDGFILTAAHVIGRPNETATITFPDGKKVKAKTLGIARSLDTGMLKILEEEGNRFSYLDVGLSADLKQGQWVMAVGHPGGIDPKRGLVFRVGRIIAARYDKLQTDCTLVGGDSGGPLVDMNGEVIGIHSRIGSQLWDNLHAPIDIYSESWDQMEDGLVLDGKPYLGFKVKPKSNRVLSVTENGPAEAAGLEKNDRIIQVNDTETPNYEELRLAITRLKPYEQASLTIKRRSKTTTLEITVSEDR